MGLKAHTFNAYFRLIVNNLIKVKQTSTCKVIILNWVYTWANKYLISRRAGMFSKLVIFWILAHASQHKNWSLSFRANNTWQWHWYKSFRTHMLCTNKNKGYTQSCDYLWMLIGLHRVNLSENGYSAAYSHTASLSPVATADWSISQHDMLNTTVKMHTMNKIWMISYDCNYRQGNVMHVYCMQPPPLLQASHGQVCAFSTVVKLWNTHLLAMRHCVGGGAKSHVLQL